MSCEPVQCEETVVSPRRRGVIQFNPRFGRPNNTQDQTDPNGPSAFPKPRKYFDSADFFMREEMKNHNSANKKTTKNGEVAGEKTHQGSSLASECQTVSCSESSDNVNKNVVPLILLRRSKGSAIGNSGDVMEDEPENLPTTVEVLNGPSNREIPSSTSSGEMTPTDDHVRGDSPTLDKSKSPRTQEEVRSLLIPRLNITHDESSLTVSSTPTSGLNSPLMSGDSSDPGDE